MTIKNLGIAGYFLNKRFLDIKSLLAGDYFTTAD
jgi:hypothetical protein